MSKLIIKGGKPITGTLRVSGNKNAVLPMLAATLLTSEMVTLTNVPNIVDVRVMIEGLQTLGAKVICDWENHTVKVTAAKVSSTVPKGVCERIRTSILFAAPLLHRTGRAKLYPPGGDVIGRRRLDTHFNGLRALGVRVTKTFNFTTEGLKGAYYLLDEASVTATENLVMAAVCAEGVTTLYNTACEPHICDLCKMLNKMGGLIDGVGTNRLKITGVPSLRGADAEVGADYIEASSYLVAALVTGGSLTLTGIRESDFDIFRSAFSKFNVRWTIDGDTLKLPVQKLKTAYDFGQAIPRIDDGPWPMIPTDLISILIVLATQTRGTMVFFEKMFESRLYFVDRLIDMGAKIVQCDPHRVVVTGPSQLQGIVSASPDIRAGMALIIAALCAKRQKTTIGNLESIDRGYESVDTNLRLLGADLVRED